MPKEKSSVQQVRRTYAATKKLYKQLGKKAFGKPKSSAAYKDYTTVKAAYRRVGRQLGNLTGRKPRR